MSANVNPLKPVRNARGQFIVESILLMIIFAGGTLAVVQYFQSNSVFAQVVSAPWQSLAGMIQNGEWQSPQSSMQLHPNNHARHASLNGVPAK
jgi:hypothetical protein